MPKSSMFAVIRLPTVSTAIALLATIATIMVWLSTPCGEVDPAIVANV